MQDIYKILIGSIALLFYLLISYFIYKKIFMADKKSAGLVDQTSPFFAPSWNWFLSAPKETVTIRSYDNVKLSAIYIPSFDEKSTNTAILCHGYHSLNTDMAVIAKMYSDLGFRVLMPDARAHGMSKGAFTSLGHYERYDLKRWIQYVLRTYGATDKLLLHGVSMGASTVIMTAAMDLPDNVRLIVADSPFTNAIAVIARSLKPRILNFFLPGISFFTLYLHRFFLGQVNVLRAVKRSRIPLFIFHGEKDTDCPISMANRLISASAASFKELYPVKEAKHAEGFIVDRPGVEGHITDLLYAYFTLPKSTQTKKTK